jgi:aminopeptidase N
MKKTIFLLILGCHNLSAQEIYTHKDSLQGGLRPERTCFNVLHYDLHIKINIEEKSIIGYNDIKFSTIENTHKIQLDLFENMTIDSIVLNSKKIEYKRDCNAVFVDFPNELPSKSEHILRFYYSGKPIIAKNAPWDGGFVYKKDTQGKPWISVACQGTGASLWYPCKDSQTDEPDFGATMSFEIPNGVMAVSNGRFKGSEDLKNGYTRWDWEVKNPINSYNINVTIADFVHTHDNYKGLDLDYYVLRDNEEKARTHFEEVKPMMDCFQSKFGTYPFKDDGYKLVETPFLGMEHQSAVAYGNKYLKGYRGNDLSGTGIGLLFDYIIVHESGHEWFGNSITSKDIADMWIHEGFTMYSEAVYVECQYGYDKAQTYINGLRINVDNDKPIIGPYNVNKKGSNDMYYKGALMLNTIRHIVNDDKKWWKMLLKFAKTFRLQLIDTKMVETFFNNESGLDLTPVFNQYLKQITIPDLIIRKDKNKLSYKWFSYEPNFTMPIDVSINKKVIRLYPSTSWKLSKIKINSLNEVDVKTNSFYIDVIKEY